jgi:hypothetical protein
MDIKINGETAVKDNYNEIVIIDGENTIRIPVKLAKKLFEQLEDTLFDETESHRFMEKKIYNLETKLMQKEGFLA